MTKKWVLLSDNNFDEKIDILSSVLNVPDTIARLLILRGIDTYDKAKTFFRPSLKNLYNPFLMKDMDKAVERLDKAIDNKEKILIYGDYDVDGTSAVALLYTFIKQFNDNIEFYIPNRDSEGYGLSMQGINYTIEKKFSLIISVDCGIKAYKQIGYAQENNIDVIVCDHHLPGELLPNAFAILDAKQVDCNYPFKELSGCGVGFKFIQAYSQKKALPFSDLIKYLDLVAISIASDLVPIVDENRILAYYGLRLINSKPRIGIENVLKYSNIIRIKNKTDFSNKSIFSRYISISDLVFLIGPRINAAGRVDTGRNSVKLLICEDEETANEIGIRINNYNLERRELDVDTTKAALKMVNDNSDYINKKSTIVFNPEWHKGVIGIVASRLVEAFYRPTIVFTQSNGFITGSARSVKDFDLYDAIDKCSDLLEHFGGHKYAAGLSIKPENLQQFIDKFESIVCDTITEAAQIPEIEIDCELSLTEINGKFYNILKQFAPFGPGNMAPVFITKGVMDSGSGKIVGSNHLKLNIVHSQMNSFPISAIAFQLGEYNEQIKNGDKFDICYTIEENEWNSNISLQLNIKDINIY